MKVYFCGSHSSGKSTLCKYVSEKYNLPIIHEAARTVLYKQELNIDDLRKDITMVDKYQESVFYEQIAEESKYNHNDFVSDRSIVDALAYSGQHSRILSKLMAAPELKPCLDALGAPQSILFFVRPSKATMRADGIREALNWESIVSIDAMIKILLEQFELRYFSISMDSMQERIRLIDAILAKS